MKRVKFRAYAQADKTWHYWDVYGEYPEGVYGGLSDPQQCTGLKDKNGVEIYEGDIIQWFEDWDEEYFQAELKYGIGKFDGGVYNYVGFYLERDGEILEPYEITNMIKDVNEKYYSYEVIGNIFEGVKE